MPFDPFYITPEWRRTRARVLKAQGYSCAWCGRDIKGKGNARVDHINPRKTHPQLALVLSNLRALCTVCDARRHAEKGGADIAMRRTDEKGWPIDPRHRWNKDH